MDTDIVGMILTEENRCTWRQICSMPLGRPQISRELTWGRTRASAIRGRRLTV